MLDTLLAVGSSHLDTLPILDGRLPVFDTLPAVGSPSHDQPEKKAGMSHMAKPFNDLPSGVQLQWQ